jgi:hypothetical protein
VQQRAEAMKRRIVVGVCVRASLIERSCVGACVCMCVCVCARASDAHNLTSLVALGVAGTS